MTCTWWNCHFILYCKLQENSTINTIIVKPNSKTVPVFWRRYIFFTKFLASRKTRLCAELTSNNSQHLGLIRQIRNRLLNKYCREWRIYTDFSAIAQVVGKTVVTPYAQKRLQGIFSALAPDIMNKVRKFCCKQRRRKRRACILNWGSRNGTHEIHAHFK